MVRQPRFQYAGAVYHVMARGNGGDVVFVNGVQLANLLRTHTTVSNAWIAERLAMGHPGSVSRSVSTGRSTKETLKSTEKIGKMLKCVL